MVARGRNPGLGSLCDLQALVDKLTRSSTPSTTFKLDPRGDEHGVLGWTDEIGNLTTQGSLCCIDGNSPIDLNSKEEVISKQQLQFYFDDWDAPDEQRKDCESLHVAQGYESLSVA